jgi:hypothetical protein
MAIGAAMAVLLAGATHAADVPVVPKKLIVVDKLSAASKAKLVYVSKDQAAGITKGAGTDVAQIDVRFDVAYDGASVAGSFTLPAGASDGTSGWLVNKHTVAKYVNKDAPGGPTQAKVAVPSAAFARFTPSFLKSTNTRRVSPGAIVYGACVLVIPVERPSVSPLASRSAQASRLTTIGSLPWFVTFVCT